MEQSTQEQINAQWSVLSDNFNNYVCEELRTDREFGAGDRVTLRGSGKVIVTEIGGRSRKDRIYVTWERFL